MTTRDPGGKVRPVLLAFLACDAGLHEEPWGRDAAPDVTPAAPALRRLTEEQYLNTVRDLLGDDVVVPTSFEPDVAEAGLLSVGAATASLSSLGVERYEDAAILLGLQVTGDRFAALSPCTPASADDAECADAFVRSFGRRAWRRALTEDEAGRLGAVVTEIGASSESFEAGAGWAVAALLQSPHFLYRREYGAPDPDDPSVRVLSDGELATRMSYLLWGTTPDDALLDAVDAGSLATDAGLRDEAERLLADERSRMGVRAFFDELFELYALDELSKDPTVFTHASEELGPAAREETLRVIEWLAFEGDFRDLLTTRVSFVDPRLAALYRVPAADTEDFAEVELPEADGRRGLLGHASTLMLHAHSTRTSATKRGIFIRETLLCQVIASPPADVDTSIPEADTTSPTLRDRLETHLEDPTCASCHQVTDPIGLGLENFDGIGRWRDTENDATIDPSGDLDGESFADAWELGGVVREHDQLGPCLTTHVYRYAMGHDLGEGEEDMVDWLAEGFASGGHDWRALLLDLVASPAFRRAGALDE